MPVRVLTDISEYKAFETSDDMNFHENVMYPAKTAIRMINDAIVQAILFNVPVELSLGYMQSNFIIVLVVFKILFRMVVS